MFANPAEKDLRLCQRGLSSKRVCSVRALAVHTDTVLGALAPSGNMKSSLIKNNLEFFIELAK